MGSAEPARFMPIIHTLIHLFDPRRPQGVPWPSQGDRILYRPALAGRYRKVTKGLGIVGAIVVACSPRATPGLKIASGCWILPSKTRSLLGPSEAWIRAWRIFGCVWNSFTET